MNKYNENKERRLVGYYFSGPNCSTVGHDKSPSVENVPGFIYTTDEPKIQLCRTGLHSSYTPAQALTYAKSLVLFKTVSWGEIVEDKTGKFSARNRLLVWKHDISRELALLFLKAIAPKFKTPSKLYNHLYLSNNRENYRWFQNSNVILTGLPSKLEEVLLQVASFSNLDSFNDRDLHDIEWVTLSYVNWIKRQTDQSCVAEQYAIKLLYIFFSILFSEYNKFYTLSENEFKLMPYDISYCLDYIASYSCIEYNYFNEMIKNKIEPLHKEEEKLYILLGDEK